MYVCSFFKTIQCSLKLQPILITVAPKPIIFEVVVETTIKETMCAKHQTSKHYSMWFCTVDLNKELRMPISVFAKR